MMYTTQFPTTRARADRGARQDLALTMEANDRFERARRKAGLAWLWHKLTHTNDHLDDLDTAVQRCKVANRYHAGSQKVAIRQIRGSEGRSQDFDADFNPVAKRVARRWQNVYLAFREGLSLPPVELVEMAGRYYVRDGHHRISVARAMGQTHVDAVVTVWKPEACSSGV